MSPPPADDYDRQLLDEVQPANWVNPSPAGRYNLVAIGGGTAGLISAIGAAGLGGRAALVEKHRLGGDCLNAGCVPSKALIRAARAMHEVRGAERFGCRLSAEPTIDFPATMQRMRRLRAEIGHHDSAERLRGLGVDVFLGAAQFTGPDRLRVGQAELSFDRAVICTGSRPAIPAIAGLAEAGYLTNESIFSLQELPQRLVVLGTGPIGVELAQVFARFGSQVTVVGRGPRLLPREEPEVSSRLAEQFHRESIELCLGSKTLRVALAGGTRQVMVEHDGQTRSLPADALLVATGRQPNLDGLELDAAGVGTGALGIEVDDFLRTANRRIYAAGDVCSRFQFTHAADAQARLALRNALFPGRQRASRLVIPRCTYTDPEIARVGLTAAEALAAGRAIDTLRVDLAEVDRAVLDGTPEGFALMHLDRGRATIAGATIVASHAGEMIGEITLLMTQRRRLTDLGRTIHCYPTQVEVLRRIADQYARRSLTPAVAAILRRWMAWRRR